MDRFLYYPSFEFHNPDFLKFSILYIENISTIIPYSGDQYLSSGFQAIQERSDLVSIVRPEEDRLPKELAANHFMEAMEGILSRQFYPRKRPKTHGQSKGLEEPLILNRPEIGLKSDLKRWASPKYQNYRLFHQKYPQVLRRFLIDTKLGHEEDHFISVTRDIGNFYMSLLAQYLGEEKDLAPITDVDALDRFCMYTMRPTAHSQRKVSLSQLAINTHLPENLNQISIERLLDFRQRKEFKPRLKSFHKALNDYISSMGNASSHEQFANEYLKNSQDYFSEIIGLGTGVGASILGIWLLSETVDPIALQYAQEALGLAGVVATAVATKRKWERNADRRNSRRYLAALRGV